MQNWTVPIKFIQPTHWLLFLIFILSSGTSYSESHNCNAVLQGQGLAPEINIELRHENFIYVNGIAVTGEFVYPLDLVLKNLKLENPKTSPPLDGKKVVSLGEGASGLLPYLNKQGALGKGVDLWYQSDEIPQNFSGKKCKTM